MKIEFKPINMQYQKVQECKEAFLELNDDHFRYFIIMRAKEPINLEDPDMGWQDDVLTSIDAFCFKINVAGIEKSYQPENEQWRVLIAINGLGDDIKMYFKKEKEAQEIFNKIRSWLFKFK